MGLVVIYYFTKIIGCLLLGCLVLTRRLVQTFGDLLTKPMEKGGLNRHHWGRLCAGNNV